MKTVFGTLFAVLMGVSIAYAVDEARSGPVAWLPLMEVAQADKPRPQTEKMKMCNKEAGDKSLKGEDRMKFMSECLKAEKKS
jgi:hypothetical protein